MSSSVPVLWIWLLSASRPAHAAGDLLAQVCGDWLTPAPVADADAPPTASAAAALRHAETYYWWSRGMGNAVEPHCRAAAAYGQALSLLDGVAGPEAEGLRVSAQAGHAQAIWRVENAFDTFRNVYPLSWWLLGPDAVVEPEDGPGALPDYYVRAVREGWMSMQAVLDDPERPRTLAVIRCWGDAALCPGLRDAMAVLADAHPRLATIPDDRGVVFAGVGPWQALVSGQPAAAGVAAALAQATGFGELVVIDLDVADTVSSPVPGVRIELMADTWRLGSDQRQRLAAGTGVGADLVPWRTLDLVWVGVVTLLGLLLSPIRKIASPPSVEAESWWLYAGQVAAGIGVGCVLGLFALRLTAPLAPELDLLALNPAGLPRMAALAWPLVYGAILLLGPLFASLFLVFGVMPRVNAGLAERLDLGLLTLSLQCGALATALAPLPKGEGPAALLACAAMAAPAMAIAAILGERVEQLRSLTEARPGRQVAPMLLGAAGLFVAFPLLLAGVAPELLLGGGAGVAALVGLVGRPPRSRSARVQAPPDSREETTGIELGGGSLRRPDYVSLDGRDISPVLSWLGTPGVSVVAVAGTAGVGKSRLGEEVCRALGATWKIGRAEAEDPHLGEGLVEPYAAVGAALGAIFDQERVELAAIYARQVAVRELAASASEALDFLPGVGLLLGMGGGGVNNDQLTLERLRRDVVRAIRRRLREQPVLLLIDDLQWADASSLSLLEHLLLELSHVPADALGHPLGVLLLHRPLESGEAQLWLERLGGRIKLQPVRLEPLSEPGVEALLRGAGVLAEAPRFAAAVRRQVGGVPLNILALVHELVEGGLVRVERAEGGRIPHIHIPATVDEDRLRAVVPGQMADIARQRLGRLRPEELLLLQGAAQCGRRFDATSLSHGFGLPRIEVLRRLRDIEDNHELITDLDDDDHFRFDTEVTRSVLIEMTTRRQGQGQRELVKEFHHRVVGALLELDGQEEWSEEADAPRLVRHALSAGNRRAAAAARYAVRAAHSAARRFAYTEALRFVEVAADPLRTDRLDAAEAARLALIEARVRRAIGGRDNRQRAIQRFASLLGSPHVETLALARDWFEAVFEEKQPSDLRTLTEAIAAVRASLPAERPDPLVGAVCDFYAALAQTWQDNLRPPDDTAALTLARLAARLRDLDDPPRKAEREQLLSWVLQAQATWTADGDEVVRLCQESLLLKERHGDLAGQALTKGVLANHYLFTRREPARARTLLEEDLQILERMGARGQRSSVLNRIAMCDWQEADLPDQAPDTAAHLRDRALQSAQQALQAAVETARAVDLIFAAFGVLTYAAALQRADLLDEVGGALVGRPEGWPWESPDALWRAVPGWQLSSKHRELTALAPALAEAGAAPGWQADLLARLTPPPPAA